MSSEGSVTSTGSRIRQFGLYRTIDARTEEFLRSSRRRQIRQGCACAAISTAITVTVVVSVILVYEYSIHSESNVNKKISIKPNWFGLMNESDLTQIDSKFTKKINFDKTTLKLLPILLKALNKNRYLEKIIEDNISSSPPYELRDDNKSYFKKNIFADAKNWLKLPSPNIHENKALHLKRPTKNLDYLTKMRKMKNYEKRVLSYFDKAINEKLSYFRAGQTPQKDIEYIENPSVKVLPKKNYTTKKYVQTTTPITTKLATKTITEVSPLKFNKTKVITYKTDTLDKSKFMEQRENKTKTLEKEIELQDYLRCKCPQSMGILLDKLVRSLQEIIPKLDDRLNAYQPCKMKTESENLKTTTEMSIPSTVSRRFEILPTPITQEYLSVSTTQGLPPIKKLTYGYNRVKPLEMITVKPRRHRIRKKTTKKPTIQILTPKIFTTDAPTRTTNIPTTKTILTERTTVKSVTTEEPTTTSISTTFTTSKTTTQEASTIPSETTTVSEETIKSSTRAFVNDTSYLSEPKDKDEGITIRSPTSTVAEIFKNIEYTYFDFPSTTTTNTISTAKVPKTTQTKELLPPFQLNDVYNEPLTRLIKTERLLDAIVSAPNYKRPIVPLFKNVDYGDYIFTTNRVPNDFANFDESGFESTSAKHVTSPAYNKNNYKKMKNRMKKLGLKLKPSSNHPVVKTNANAVTMKSTADLNYLPTSTRKMGISKSTLLHTTPTIRTYFVTNANTKKPTGFLKSLSDVQNPVKFDKRYDNFNSHILDQVNNDALEDDFQEWIQETENIDAPIRYINKTIPVIQINEPTRPTKKNDKAKIKDKVMANFMNSMLPPSKPLYLIVRRNNDWKADEREEDYDLNFGNNIFDLPNI